MMAHHVMLAWYMCSFEIFYGIWTSIAKKNLFLWFSRGNRDPLLPPLDPPMIRLLPSANWTVFILRHTEWWYQRQILKNDESLGNCWHVASWPHDHRAIALGLQQDDSLMSVRFYGPCKGIVRRPCRLLTTIARVYDHFWAKMTI